MKLAILATVIALSAQTLAQNALDGAWEKPCEQIQEDFVRSSLRIENDLWHFIHWGFEEADCKKNYIQFERVFKATAHWSQLDLEVQDVLYTPLTEEVANALAAVHFCGFQDWKVGVRKSVLNQACESVDNYRSGQIIYTRAHPTAVESKSLLYIGEGSEGFDGTSPEKRHRFFEIYAYEKSK